MNRNYYKQGQSNKMTYILILVILALLYIMNGMNEDRKDADRMFNTAIKEFKSPSCDSLVGLHKNEVDSLTAVIEWYRKQDHNKTNAKQYKKEKNKEHATNEKQAVTTTDTII